MLENNTSTRLLLNTTINERHYIRQLMVQSGCPSESELLRMALRWYLILHGYVQGGHRIIARSKDGTGQCDIFIPLKWEAPSVLEAESVSKDAPREKPIREVLEIRLERRFKEMLEKFVADGFAPSLIALAGAALEVCASVLVYEKDDYHILVQRNLKLETILLLP